MSNRREGDPAALVAGAEKIHQTLNWQPAHDDLQIIVRHALDWESHLAEIVSHRLERVLCNACLPLPTSIARIGHVQFANRCCFYSDARFS